MKKTLVTIFSILVAIVGGHYLGIYCANNPEPMLSWLGYVVQFGFNTVSFNLSVIQLDFGLHIGINFVQLVLILIAALAGPKIAEGVKKKG